MNRYRYRHQWRMHFMTDSATDGVRNAVEALLSLLQYELQPLGGSMLTAKKETPTGLADISILCLESRPEDLLKELEGQPTKPRWVVYPGSVETTVDDRAAAELMEVELMSLTRFLDRTFRARQIASRIYQDQE